MDNPEINKYLKWLASEYEERSHVTPHSDAQYLAEQLRKLLKEKHSLRLCLTASKTFLRFSLASSVRREGRVSGLRL
jgi:hypothetical protein